MKQKRQRTSRRLNKLTRPLIYLITGGDAHPQNFAEKKLQILEIIQTAIETKVSLIQIREKNLPARSVFELALDAAELAQNSGTGILVNDRADIALAAGADGVHLTSKSLEAGTIRRTFPTDFIIGVSTHSIEEAEKAKSEGADFVTFSPIFPTVSKAKYGVPQGLEKLHTVCEIMKPFPVIALGGIDETNYRSALEFGAAGFAAIRFLNNTKNLKILARESGKKVKL